MKNTADRLHRVLAIASSEERRECLALGKTQRALDAERHRADELAAYRASYSAAPASDRPVHPARWQDYRNFLGRLDHALELQAAVIRDTERSVDAHRARWLVKRQRLQSLERVVERHRDAARRHDERLAQKALDELPAGRDAFGD